MQRQQELLKTLESGGKFDTQAESIEALALKTGSPVSFSDKTVEQYIKTYGEREGRKRALQEGILTSQFTSRPSPQLSDIRVSQVKETDRGIQKEPIRQKGTKGIQGQTFTRDVGDTTFLYAPLDTEGEVARDIKRKFPERQLETIDPKLFSFTQNVKIKQAKAKGFIDEDFSLEPTRKERKEEFAKQSKGFFEESFTGFKGAFQDVKSNPLKTAGVFGATALAGAGLVALGAPALAVGGGIVLGGLAAKEALMPGSVLSGRGISQTAGEFAFYAPLAYAGGKVAGKVSKPITRFTAKGRTKNISKQISEASFKTKPIKVRRSFTVDVPRQKITIDKILKTKTIKPEPGLIIQRISETPTGRTNILVEGKGITGKGFSVVEGNRFAQVLEITKPRKILKDINIKLLTTDTKTRFKVTKGKKVLQKGTFESPKVTFLTEPLEIFSSRQGLSSRDFVFSESTATQKVKSTSPRLKGLTDKIEGFIENRESFGIKQTEGLTGTATGFELTSRGPKITKGSFETFKSDLILSQSKPTKLQPSITKILESGKIEIVKQPQLIGKSSGVAEFIFQQKKIKTPKIKKSKLISREIKEITIPEKFFDTDLSFFESRKVKPFKAPKSKQKTTQKTKTVPQDVINLNQLNKQLTGNLKSVAVQEFDFVPRIRTKTFTGLSNVPIFSFANFIGLRSDNLQKQNTFLRQSSFQTSKNRISQTNLQRQFSPQRINTNIKSLVDSTQRTSTITRPATETTTETIFRTISPNVPITPGINVPFINIPTIIPPIIPPLNKFELFKKPSKTFKRKKSKRPFKYTASLEAISLQIYGKQSKNTFGLRPIF